MAQHLLKFIRGEIDKLDDEKNIMYRVYKQNPDYDYFVIDFDDILEWARKMNPTIKYDVFEFKSTIMEINTIQTNNPYKVFKYNNKHMSVMYHNGKRLSHMKQLCGNTLVTIARFTLDLFLYCVA